MVKNEYRSLKIICETEKEISMDELSRFFYYLNNIYKILFLYETKKNIKFYYIKCLKKEERLKITIIKKSSPLEFVISIPIIYAGLKTIQLFIEIIKTIINYRFEKERYRLEIEKLKLENELLKREIEKILRLKEIRISEIYEY